MDYNTDDIIKLLVKDKYLSPLKGTFFKTRTDLITVTEASIDALRDNLTISLGTNNLSPRNIRDFNALLKAIENIKDNVILSVDIVDNTNRRTIYIDRSLKMTFDEL